jgi:putative acyl-CoA dehydrogenase
MRPGLVGKSDDAQTTRAGWTTLFRAQEALGGGKMTNWRTHEVANQFDELVDYNLFRTDVPLQEALQREQALEHTAALDTYGAWLGQSSTYALAQQANRFTPELKAFDPRGRRVDQVDFHPAWHAFMAKLRQQGLVSLPFEQARPGRWAAWAAGFYLHGQVEAGSLCPTTMTQAAIPVLRHESALWDRLQARLLSKAYDARDLPIADKESIWIGMGMTEKQGGSDVRANTTTAIAVADAGRGAEYRLRGHKWFFSAPMCDAHLVVAREAHGHSCFFVPRWRPDGQRNGVQIQRLKGKVGNCSNASAEVEFQDAYGILMGEEGRGIPTIIEMATYTRLNCVVGSAAMLRQGLVQALAYTRQRRAFGRTLAEQPLMRAVLVDLALESEAALVLMMRLARAFEHDREPGERAWKRIMTPAAKFWVCKRAVELSGEMMEIFGGNGYVDESVMGRLFREAPVNSIWEGSGNVMCLDVMRALAREPEAARSLLDELARDGGDEPRLARELHELRGLLDTDAERLEAQARRFAARLVLLAQACLLRPRVPAEVFEAFLATRFEPHWGSVSGTFDASALPVEILLARAFAA